MLRSRLFRLPVYFVLYAFSTGAQSLSIAIGAPINAYSFIRPGFPNYGIAQGAIFTIFGSNLSGATASQGVPLQTTFKGVNIDVVVEGVTTRAIPYYVSPEQINALLPSHTPVGDGSVTVTSGGKTASAPVHVVRSTFGLLVNSAAANIAVVQNSNQGGQLLNQTNAANPGEYLVLWGSGLGPISGDETQYQTPRDLADIPIEVDIGGVSAAVVYHGRSVYPGLDQINVIVPPGVLGCYVSVVVVVGGTPSNFATIPVAPRGRTCSDPELIPFTPEENRKLLSLETVKVGAIFLSKLMDGSVGIDSASALFQKYPGEQVISAGLAIHASLQSCVVLNGGLPGELPPFFSSTPPAQLNAGPQINVKGPEGSLTLVQRYPGYAVPIGTSPSIIPQAGGAFAFDNGSGGLDVGPFTGSLSVTLVNPFVWTNRTTITNVHRASGQLVSWTGGLPGTYVSVSGYSFAHENSRAGNGSDEYTYFTCSVPVSAGQFTVPAAVLQSLFSSGSVLGAGLPPAGNGYLKVVNATSQRFTASGLDLGLMVFGSGTGISVPFN